MRANLNQIITIIIILVLTMTVNLFLQTTTTITTALITILKTAIATAFLIIMILLSYLLTFAILIITLRQQLIQTVIHHLLVLVTLAIILRFWIYLLQTTIKFQISMPITVISSAMDISIVPIKVWIRVICLHHLLIYREWVKKIKRNRVERFL